MTSLPGEQEENLGKKPKRDSTTEIIIIAISKYGRKSYDKQGRDKCDLYMFNIFCVFFLFFLFRPDDKYRFKTRDRLHPFGPESGCPLCRAAQRIRSHAVPSVQQAAVSTADERSSPPMASGGSERHQHIPDGDAPSQHGSRCPCTFLAWEVRGQGPGSPRLAPWFIRCRPSWLQVKAASWGWSQVEDLEEESL